MGLIKLLVSFGLALVFAISVIAFVTNFGNDNDAYVQLGDDPEFSSLDTQLRDRSSTFTVSVNSSGEIMERSRIKSGDENVEGGGAFKIVKGDLFSAVKDIIGLTRTKIFGGDTNFGIVFGILTALLSVMIILYIWKVWKGGNPD